MQRARKSAWFLVLAVAAGLSLLTYLEYRAFQNLPKTGPRPVEEKRNIYLITASGLRPDHLSSYMYPSIQTPALDFLAYDGIRFLNGFTTSTESLAAHLSLLSGIYPFRKPIQPLLDYYYARTSAQPQQTGFSMPEWFRRRGYRTAAILSDPDLRVPSLFSGIFETACYGDREVLPWESAYTLEGARRLASEWVDHNTARPHLLLLNLNEPTPPYDPPPPFDRHYANHPYDGEIAAVDEQVGLFINYLKKTGLFERSILIFAAPYARGPGEMPPPYKLKDDSLKIPIFVAAPGILPRQKEYLSVASLVDLFPTVLSLLEMEHAGLRFDGTPLFEKGNSREVTRSFIFGASFYPTMLGQPRVFFVRSPGWKLVTGPPDEMYAGSSSQPVQSESSSRMADEMKTQLEGMIGRRRQVRVGNTEQLDTLSKAQDALALGRIQEAEQVLAEAENLPSTPGMLWLRAELASLEGRLGESMALLTKAYRTVASPEVLAAQARVRLRSFQFREAGEQMRRYRKSSLSLSYYDYNTIGMIEMGSGRCAAAVPEFEKALQNNPRFAEARYRIGLCRLSDGDEAGALADLRAAADLDPRSTELARTLCTLLLRSPAPQDAVPYLRQLIKLDSADQDSRLQLAQLLATAGDAAEAEKLAREVLIASPNPLLQEAARKLIAAHGS